MLNEISLLIEKNELSILKDKILSQSEYKKTEDLITILGIINTLNGKFQAAIDDFSKLEDNKFFKFMVETINSDYIPLYNQLLKEIQKNNSEVEELFLKLEKILPNIELYEMMTIYYLEKSNMEKASLTLSKGLEIDASSTNLLKLKNYFNISHQKNSTKQIIGIAALIVGIVVGGTAFTYNNRVESEKESKLKYVNRVNNQEKAIEKLEDQLVTLQKTNKGKKEKIIEEAPKLVRSNFIDDFTQRELYRKAQTYRKNNSFEKAIEYYNLVVHSEEETYLKRESLFWLGRSYEDLDNITKAIESFEEYTIKYSDKKIYLEEVESRLKKLGKMEE